MFQLGLVRQVLRQSILFSPALNDPTPEASLSVSRSTISTRQRGVKRRVSLCSPIILVVLAAMLLTLIQDSNGTSNGAHCGRSMRPSGGNAYTIAPSSLPTFLRVFEDCAAEYDVGITIGDVLRWVTPVLPSHVNVCPTPKQQPFGMDGSRLVAVPPQHANPLHNHPMVLFTEELLHILETNTQGHEMILYLFKGVVIPSIQLLFVTLPFILSHFLFRPPFPLLEPSVLALVLAFFVAREVCRRTQVQRSRKPLPVATLDFITTLGWAWVMSAVLLVAVAIVVTSSAGALYNSVLPHLVARVAGVDAAMVRYETGLFRRQILLC